MDFEKCGINKDVPLTADSKTAVSTPLAPGKWEYPTRLETRGITPEEHEAMLNEQNGVCAICGWCVRDGFG